MPIKLCMSKFDAPISFVIALQSGTVGVVTADHEIYLYDTLTDSKEKLLHFNVPRTAEFIYAFDPHNMRVILGSKENQTLHMIDLLVKKQIHRFELHKQSPTAIAFSPDGEHFVCGTDHGRVLLWRSDTTTMISRLHSFPEYTSLYTKPKINYVSAIAFHENMVATSGYGGSVVLTNYRTQTHTQRFSLGTMKNQALLFYKDTVIVGNQNGVLLKINRNKKISKQRLPTALGEIKDLVQIGSSYVLVVSKQNYISLLNAETMKIIKERYIELSHPITWISRDDTQHLFLGTLSGELYQFDLHPFHQLEKLIASKAYTDAYRYCDEEPLLQESESYLLLESIFEEAVQKTKDALEKGEIEQAKKLLDPFKPVKFKETAPFFSTFTSYNRLKYLYEHKKFAPFYGLIEQYPLLESTHLYKEVESIWTKRFIKAQKLMFTERKREAQIELEPFTSVQSKRPLVQLLLHHSDILKTYSKAIHENNFPLLNQLTQRHPILKKLPSYVQLIERVAQLADTITETIKNKEFERADALLNKIGKITQFEHEYLRLKAFRSFASNLHHAIENSHWRSAYHLLDTYPELMALPWAQEIENRWYEKLRQCEVHAIRGDMAAIKQTLGNLINLQNRHHHIGDILRMTYQIQLKKIQAKNPEKFTSGILNYCEFFGMDTEIRHLLEKTKNYDGENNNSQLPLYPKKRDEWLSYIHTLPDTIV